MLRHLSIKHGIVNKEQVKTTVEHVSNFLKLSTYTTARSTKDRQERISSDTTIMYSRDLQTYSIVSYESFQVFSMAYGIFNHADNIASRATSNPFHLNELYNAYLDFMVQALKRVPHLPVMTCDIWIGKYGHRS